MNIYDSNMDNMKKGINKKIGLLLVWILWAGQINLSAQDILPTDSVKLLNDNNKQIDIAFGKQVKKAVTSSTSILYSDELLKNTVTNVGNALSGRLPGLTVMQQSGEPGADMANLLIRGRNTYNVNSPLLLVDGFETDFQQLALFEIDNISVLKDAAALALYGQKGANGAILVTTKRGKEGKTRITFNLYGGVQQPQKMPSLLDSYQYATLYNEALQNDGLPALYSQTDLGHYQSGDDPYLFPNNNFFDQLIKTSSSLIQGDIGLQGGNKILKYFVSMNYMKNGGLYNFSEMNSGYNTQSSLGRYNLRANLDIDITDRLTAKIDIGGRLDDRHYPGRGAAEIWNGMYNTPPLAYPMLNPNGTIGGNQQYTNNPYGLLTGSGYQSSSERNLNVSVRLKYNLNDLVKGLSAGIAGSVSNWMQAIDNKSRTLAVYALQKGATAYSYTKIGENSALNWVTGSGHTNRNSFEANLNYEATKGDNSLTAMLVYHMDRYVVRGSHLFQGNQGFSGRIQYGYKNRYFAEVTSGYYGSEVFAKGKQFGLFPAAALGWVVSDEDFVKNSLPFMNFLKLRGSYGLTGSNTSFTGISVTDRIFFNQYYAGATGYAFGPSMGTTKVGRQEGRMANPDLTWDKAYKTDLSAEMTLFNHINFMFTWFNELRTDILTVDAASIPETLGFSNGRQPYRNGGEVKNHGYETTLGYFGSAGDFKYSVEAGLWFNRSEITKKPDLTIYPDAYRNATGKPVGQIFGLEAIGYYKDAADVANYPKQMFGIAGAGDVIYKDLNGDNRIDDNDKKPIGYSSVPEYTYSLNLSLKYRNFDFAAFFQGVANSSVMLGGYFIPFSAKGNAYDYAFDRWTSTNQNSAFPRLTTVANANNNQSSTIWLRSADYLKLRNLEIGYKLPSSILKKISIDNIRFFARGMNLFTNSKEIDFIDPESTTGYPSMKSVSLGVNVTL
jgi:TonB-linked SusC/RagA family outer membrane protein